MAGYRLVSVKIKGFRAFPEQAGTREFCFDEPCNVLFGVQGGGKSSILSAIEWCVFGDKIAVQSETKIQERKGWLIRNKKSSEASVEVTFEKEGETLKVYRSDRKQRGHSQFYYQVNGGSPRSEETGLRALLGLELADYMSCVHLHQEVISALLVETPSERKNALDRLMGLAPLRNLGDGVAKAKVSEALKAIDTEFNGIEGSILTAMRLKDADLQRAIGEAEAQAIPVEQISLEGAKERCETFAGEVRRFTDDTGLPPQTLPEPQTLDDLQGFIDSGKQCVRRLRNEQPDLKRQTELLKRRNDLDGLRSSFEGKKIALKDLVDGLNKLKEAYGDPPAIADKLQKIEGELLPDARNRLNTVNYRAGVVRETLRLLDSPASEGIQECPVCESKGFDAVHIREHLQSWQNAIQDTLAPIEEEIRTLEDEVTNLQKATRNMQSLEEQSGTGQRQLADAARAIAEALRRDIQEGDDPLALVAQELEQVDGGLQAIRAVVEQSNARLDEMDDGLEDVRRIVSVLNLRRDIEDLSRVKDSPEYRKVVQARQDAHAFGDRVQTIREAIQSVLLTTAAATIGSTKASVSALFRELARRSDFPDIKIDPEQYEVMAVRDGESEVALRILNKGDINCAALSIFLALAISEDLTHNIGFIILDDPSQCLDPEHKERLAALLDGVLERKQLLIATSEEDFGVSLQSKLTKRKRTYRIRAWAENDGPKISIE